MYGYIKGIIKSIEPTNIIVENNEIGYLIITPNPYSFKIDSYETIYVHHYVREDVNNLYGFKSIEAKRLFIKLIGVNGIGPKSALSILANENIEDIINAILMQDIDYIIKFPGIGKKSAQQIILDLNGKLEISDEYIKSNETKEASDALLALGYSKKDVLNVMKKVDETLSVEEMIKDALKKILK